MMINIIQNMSWVDSNSIAGTEVVNKEHKNYVSVANWNILHNKFYDNYNIDNNIRLMVLKSFHSTVITGPGWYNYHSFMIIAQPYSAVGMGWAFNKYTVHFCHKPLPM